MTDDEILRGIAEVARQRLDHTGELRADMRLVEDLELDSIRLLTLAMEVEDRFRVRLDEADEVAIETVADLVAVVRHKLAGQPAAAAARANGTGESAARVPAPRRPARGGTDADQDAADEPVRPAAGPVVEPRPTLSGRTD